MCCSAAALGNSWQIIRKGSSTCAFGIFHRERETTLTRTSSGMFTVAQFFIGPIKQHPDFLSQMCG
jgi:hypothetical protein